MPIKEKDFGTPSSSGKKRKHYRSKPAAPGNHLPYAWIVPIAGFVSLALTLPKKEGPRKRMKLHRPFLGQLLSGIFRKKRRNLNKLNLEYHQKAVMKGEKAGTRYEQKALKHCLNGTGSVLLSITSCKGEFFHYQTAYEEPGAD